MVIGGEKTPAFSARTLELPPSQADNTPHIIEHSRRMYSRSREDVEREIAAVIMPPRPHKQPAQPRPQAVAAAALAQPVQINQIAAAQPTQEKASATTSAQHPAPQPQPVAPVTDSGEVILQIRGNSAFESAATDTATPKKRRRRRKKSTT
jgi:hypothetical protein